MPFGYIPSETCPITYQIGNGGPFAKSMDDYDSDIDSDKAASSDSLRPIPVNSFHVWPAGVNNDDPTVCKELIKGNRLLPSVLEKQISILYGRGPQLFREDITEDGGMIRHYLKDAEIQKWLESWKEMGVADDYRTYLNECIRSFYYSEGIFSKYRLSRGARLGLPGFLPVVGLEHISETRARFCTRTDMQRLSMWL